MVSDPHVFTDLAFVFLAAVVGGSLAWALRQPLILGYVFGGLLISPFTPGPSVSDPRSFDLFAEIGVVLLMFSIGLEFSVRDLLRVKWIALLGGPLGVLLFIGMGTGAGVLLGWGVLPSLAVGVVISVSSTMVLARLLLDRGELHSHHGRIMMGLSLVEDLAAVALMVLLPSLGELEPGRFVAIALALGKAALILIPFLYLVSRVIPPLLNQMARMRSAELFLLVALAIGLGTAALTQAVGLSLALGAFLAGLIISESDYAHETLARLLPLRDTFGALFFVTVGGLIDPRTVLESLPILVGLVVLIVVGKAVLRTGVVWLFGEPLSIAALVGVGLAQIGEFSFVLVQVARNAGHVGLDIYNAILAASLLTILINAALMRIGPGWIGRLRLGRAGFRRARAATRAEGGPRLRHVVLCGFGRVGSAIGEAFDSFEQPYVVIEPDAGIIRGLRERGVPCVYGDATRRRVLERAGAAGAALVVVALPEIDRANMVVRNVRTLNRDAPVLVRSHDPSALDTLLRAGATEIIQPEVEAAATLIRHALRRLALPQDRVLAYLDRFHRAMVMDAGAEVSSRDHLPQLADVTLGPGALADQSLREARIRERLGVTVVAVTHVSGGGGTVVNPSAETILRAGDRVRVFGLPEQIAAFRGEATSGA
jgi:CPA2 family monovalent cation:H+ antiporter-2